MAITDDIISAVRESPGLTAMEITLNMQTLYAYNAGSSLRPAA